MSLVYIVCVLILLDDESFKWIDSNGTRDKFFFGSVTSTKDIVLHMNGNDMHTE